MILLLCILLNVLVAVVFKLFPVFQIDVKRAIVVNYFTCVATAWLTDMQHFSDSARGLSSFVHWSLPMGILFFSVFLIIGKTVATHGVMVATTSQKLSLILPVLVAITMFGEAVTVAKASGLLAAVMAVLYINSNGKQETKTLITAGFFSFPLLTWLGSSLVDLSLFLSEKYKVSANMGLFFTASIFGFAGLTGLLYVIYTDLRTGEKWKKKDVIAGILLGIPNFFSIYLIVVLLSHGWQGSVLFPILNVAIILLTTGVGILGFKEDFSRRRQIGFILAIAAIILLSLPWK